MKSRLIVPAVLLVFLTATVIFAVSLDNLTPLEGENAIEIPPCCASKSE